MKMNKAWLAAGALVALSSSAFAQNLIANGNFETYTGVTPLAAGQYQTVGSTASGPNFGAITGWTVGGTSVDVIRVPGFNAISNISIDLAGTPGPGSVSQTFNSIIGQSYLLTWDYRNNGGFQPLAVTFGETTGSFAVANGMPLTFGQLWYTAIATSTTVMFASGPAQTNGGPVIDNVSVTAVPEPSTYAMALAALALVGGLSRVAKRTQA